MGAARNQVVIHIDTGHMASRIAAALSRIGAGPRTSSETIVRSRYETFATRVTAAVERVHYLTTGAAVRTVDMDELTGRLTASGAAANVVNLHPLIDLGPRNLRLSRLYDLHDGRALGYAPSPGSPPLDVQLTRVKDNVGNGPVTLLDDDCFSGGFLRHVVASLDAIGLPVGRVCLGVLIDTKIAMFLEQRDIELSALLDLSGADVLDICDVRDFLIGGSGLVVRFPDDVTGRVPYLAPFVDIARLVSTTSEMTPLFTSTILRANIEFFTGLESDGVRLGLEQVDDGFRRHLRNVLGCDGATSLATVARRLLDLS